MTYQGNRTCDQHRPREDVDPPRKEELHGDRDDGAHDVDEKPAVVNLGEGLGLPVVVDEHFESDTGDEPGLDPFENEHAIHWKSEMSHLVKYVGFSARR